MNSHIQAFLKTIRRQRANSITIRGLLKFLFLFIAAAMILIIVESILYLDTYSRSSLISLVLTLTAVALGFLVLRWIIQYFGRFGNSTDSQIARLVGERIPKISDRLLNTYQLENLKDDPHPGNDLTEFAVDRMGKQLQTISPAEIKDPFPRQVLLALLGLAGFSTILILLFFSSLPGAGIRLLHPKTDFPVPLPFTLLSLSGNQDILGGDSLSIAFSAIGEAPDSLNLNWSVKGVERSIILQRNDDVYSYQFDDIRADLVYWADVQSTSWFSPWDQISSDPDTVFVTDRPLIEDVLFTITPPYYTREPSWTHPGNVTDVTVLSGSMVSISAVATKPLSLAWVLLGTERRPLDVLSNRIRGSFNVEADELASIFCLDQNDVGNLNPAQYRITAIPDFPPDLIVAEPERDIDLDESQLVYFNLQLNDDFGFSSAEVQFKIKRPDYLSQDTTTYIHPIPELIPEASTQQIFHSWHLDELYLAPDDELRFQVIVWDNNTLTGPSSTISPIFRARYPSLEDLYMALDDSEQEVTEESEMIQMSLEDVRELVEDMKLEMLKAEDMDWEHQQKAEQISQKMDDVMEQIQDLQKGLEQINEQLQKNDLVNSELQDKFSKLQELLDQILTPELLEAMEELAKAMQQMDPQQMLQALENFDFNVAELEEQLDRFIDMFEQAIAEQKMDEVVQRLQEMVAEQSDIMEELTSDTPPDYTELASRERRQEEDFSRLEELMKDAAKAMEQFAAQPAQELSDLQKSDLAQETDQALESARQEMQQSSPSCQQPAGQAEQNLTEMLEAAMDIQQQFQQQTVAEMMKDFQRVLQNTLSVSQEQEFLRQQSEGLRSNSPVLQDIAAFQDQVRRRTDQLFAQLMELSRKTFHITPGISRALGKAHLSMEKSIAQLEQKKVSSARKDQNAAMEGLNQAARQMLDAMEEMQSSGSASGFESFMEQMEQMSQQQQGINQGTMQLGQMGMMAQQQMMQRLQAQQQALQQSLNEMLSEMPGEQSGGLNKASEEMEEVIEDFKRRQVTRRTTERQERILSRMLDSQKSMTQRDYSEKRRSTTGEEFTYDGPAGLPEGLGDRDLLLMKAMEDALNEGYSREYQNMMKTYFRQLQKNAQETGTLNDEE